MCFVLSVAITREVTTEVTSFFQSPTRVFAKFSSFIDGHAHPQLEGKNVLKALLKGSILFIMKN